MIDFKMQVLILNSSYEPHQILPLNKAIKLVVKNRAEIIKSVKNETITSCYEKMPKPSVLLLNNYVKYHRETVRFSKKNVLARDKYTCQYCGSMDSKMTIDHVYTPKSQNGKLEFTNTVACCSKCNFKKADKSLEEFLAETGYILKNIPKTPSHFALMKKYYDRLDWQEFLFV